MTYSFSTNWFKISEIKKNILNIVDTTHSHNILEIGSFEGASACFFSDNLLETSDSTLTCVDPFDVQDETTSLTQTTKSVFYENIKKSKNYDKIKVIELYSKNFYKINTKKYDIIYIDGSHLLKDITIDFINCLNIIEDNGIIWMDDYLGGNGETMKEHINNLYIQHKHNLKLIHIGYEFAFQKIK